MEAGTIVASNYLAMAQVLGESFLMHHPDSTFSVLVVDDGDADLPDAIDVVRLGDLDIAPRDERLMRTVYDVMEFSTAVKPSFLRLLLERGGDAATACYLDPDIQVFAPFASHADAALEHGIVLTPHVLEPVPRDGLRVDEETIMQSGMYNCGFLAVGPSARPFLDWWDERLRFDALVDFGRARFTDQRWVDWVPSLFDFTIDRDPGLNVAWWNIHDRPIEVEASGATVQGTPLRFVHFSGYDPQQPGLLSKHQLPRPRTAHEPGTGIRALAEAYGERLIELGHVRRRREAYPWNRSHDGVELTMELRRIVRDAALGEIEEFGEVRSVPDAFDPSTDFAGWVADRIGVEPWRESRPTTLDGDIPIVRITPDVDQEPTQPHRPESRSTYDVDFDWTDAHGHAVRLLLDNCEPGIVIDLGCGYAPHAEILRDAGFEFVGLDIDEASLERLGQRGFVTHRSDLGRPDEIAETITDALAELASSADVVAILALDVLEHLVAPERLLAVLSDWLADQPGSLLVTSVPNVAHHDIAAKLLAGRWDVTPTGLLDHTHLRFFTDSSLTAVMASAGFSEAFRNDRIATRSDQRFPSGAPTTSPHTPVASMIRAIRETADDHGATYQLIRGYRPVSRDREPTLSVVDLHPPTVALTVIADPSGGADERERLRAQLDAQASADWELLGCDAEAESAADRIATFDAMVAAATGAYVAFVERGEQIGPRWVQQFVDAMTVTVAGGAPDGDVIGHVLRCETIGAEHDEHLAAVPTSAALAFPTAALRSVAPAFGGSAHQAVRLHAHLAPICGELATGEPAVIPADGTPADSWSHHAAIRSVGDASGVASMFGRAGSLQAEVDRLRAENDQLAAHRDDLARTNEWLNAELSPAPIRLLRRMLRRDASLNSAEPSSSD